MAKFTPVRVADAQPGQIVRWSATRQREIESITPQAVGRTARIRFTDGGATTLRLDDDLQVVR